MTAIEASAYLPPLDEPHEREAVGRELQVVPNGQAGAVVELTRRIAEVSERTRERMNRLGELDLASQDVLIEVVRELEKQRWMLRVQLRGGS
jgi:DNA-binding ferritin-like protein